jgi:hypothetical protein
MADEVTRPEDEVEAHDWGVEDATVEDNTVEAQDDDEDVEAHDFTVEDAVVEDATVE